MQNPSIYFPSTAPSLKFPPLVCRYRWTTRPPPQPNQPTPGLRHYLSPTKAPTQSNTKISKVDSAHAPPSFYCRNERLNIQNTTAIIQPQRWQRKVRPIALRKTRQFQFCLHSYAFSLVLNANNVSPFPPQQPRLV